MHVLLVALLPLLSLVVSDADAGTRGSCADRPALQGVSLGYAGTVASRGSDGSWILDAADGSTQTVYGLGPAWFWEQEQLAQPKIGEKILVMGLVTDCQDGRHVFVATSVTLGDKTLELRDANGRPRWAGGRPAGS